MEHIGKKSLLVTLAFILASTLMIPLGNMSHVAWADEVAAMQDDTQSGSTTVDGVTLVIKAGAAELKEGTTNTYRFPRLTVESNTDRKIKSITVQFTSAITANDSIALAGSGKFVRYDGSKRANVSINVTDGATADEWAEYLRQNLEITLDGTSTKSLRMIASFDPVNTLVDYNSLNGHYYETVKTKVNWETAYEACKTKKYMGMQGYLVTVTSQAEHDYVYTMISENCWTAATSWDTYTAPIKNTYVDWYKSKGITIPATTHTGSTEFYFWTDGPEKGKICSYGPLGGQVAAPDPDGDPVFLNWASGEPNNSSGEFCMHFFSSQSGKWNDYANTNQCFYVIEYGGMEGDDDSGADTSGGDGDANVDVYVKVDINIDPEGKTITTEADNISVGQPLSIRENVNGGDVVTITGRDANKNFITEPTTPTRTFYQLKPGGNVNRDADWILMDEEPKHVGTYKVVSNAVFQQPFEQADGQKGGLVDYKPGSTTFKIVQKSLDLTDPATPVTPSVPEDPDHPLDPDDPNNPNNPDNPNYVPDGTKDTIITDVDPADPSNPEGTKVSVMGRNYLKTYDGTNTLPGGSINISDLVQKGAQAYITYTDATYVDSNAGTGKELVLHGVEIHGLEAADYAIKGLQSGGDLTVKGIIAPRELVIDARYPQDPTYDLSTWITGVAYVDPTNKEATEPTYHTNATEAAADADIATLPQNFLVPGDTIADVLGDDTYTVQTRGGLVFDADNPQVGTYILTPHYSKVKGQGGAQGFLTENGNYVVKLNTAQLKVTERPVVNITETEEGDPDPIVIEEPVKPTAPKPDPIGDDEIKKIIEEHFPTPGDNPDNPDNPGGDKPGIPEDVDPIITITKGGTVVPEIDPSEPGEYHIHVVYPDPDGTDVEVDIIYVVENPPATTDPEAVTCHIITKLKGATAGATITPSMSVIKGSNAHVAWTPGEDAYVALVEVDGKPIDTSSTEFNFESITANHEVVVTLAAVPVIKAPTTNGFYTITVNTYGATAGIDAISPSAITTKGDDHAIAWRVLPGYRVQSVSIDGKKLSADQIAQGSYTFMNVSANHAVDIVLASEAGDPMLSQDMLQVTTKIEGGPGMITGGSTITKGGAYKVEWEPIIQTTTDRSDPNYAVYEVVSVKVNDVLAAGNDDRELELANIKENKEVVVTLKPVTYNVKIMTYGNGTAKPSRTVFKGNHYVDIDADAAAGARITYIEVDGQEVYKEASGTGAAEQAAEASLNMASVATLLSTSVDAFTRVEPTDGDGADQGSTQVPTSSVVDTPDPGATVDEAEAKAPDTTTETPSPSSGSDNAGLTEADDTPATDDASAVFDQPEAVDQPEASDPSTDALAAALQSEQIVDALAQTAQALAAITPEFGVENVIQPTRNDANTHMDMGITDIDKDHLIKVYFADVNEDPATPDSLKDQGKTPVEIEVGIEGGPGEITGGGIYDKDTLDPANPPKVSWDIPETYMPTEVVITPKGGTNPVVIPITDPDTKEITLPDWIFGGDGPYEVSLVTDKRVEGDDIAPLQRDTDNPNNVEQGEKFLIETHISGGPGTITANTEVGKGSSQTVTWTAGEYNGVKYRVAKVLIDGVEHPELVNATEYTFADIAANHSIEVVLEPVPDAGQGENGDGSSQGANTDQKGASDDDSKGSTTKTGDTNTLAVVGISMLALLAAGAILALRRFSKDV